MKQRVDNVFLDFRMICHFVLLTIVLSFSVYIQQEYSLQNQLSGQVLLDEALKSRLLESFDKYQWLIIIVSPLAILLRVLLVSSCLFIGIFLSENYRKVQYLDCFNVALKADTVLVFSSAVYALLIVVIGYEYANIIIQRTSMLALFDIEILEPWLIIIISTFNIFELVYCLLIGKFLSIITGESYYKSLKIVMCTYGVGLFLYMLFSIFMILYATE